MKKIIRKTLSLFMALAMIFSLGVPALADSISSNLVGDKQEIRRLQREYAVEEADIVDVLNTYPNAEEQLGALAQQADAYGFTDEQVNLHIQGMKTASPSAFDVQYGTLSPDKSMYILPDGRTVPNRYYKIDGSTEIEDFIALESGIEPFAFSSNYQSNINSGDQSGVYWVVESTTGHNQATAFFNLPTVTAAANAPDRPYMFFSVNTTSSSVCGDYGVVYYPSTQSWALCTNTKVWNSATSSYVPSWQQIELPSNYGPSDSLYMHLLITNTTGTDKVTITVKDGVSFAVLAELSCEFTGNPFNSSLSNINIYREVTMAQHLGASGLLNTSTGTCAMHSKFSMAYLYTTSGYYVWGTARTSTAYRQAPSSSQLSTVSVNTYTKWDSEDISICFNQ